MSYSGISRQRSGQAQQLAPLNREHWIFRGLVGLWVPAVSSKNLIGASDLFVPSARSATPGAMSGRFAGELSTEAALLTANWSFATAFVSGTAASISAVLGRGPSSPNNTGFGFHASHTNATYAGAIYCGSGYSVIGKPTGGALANGQRYVIGASVTGSAGAVFSNGRRTASATGLSAVNTSGRLSLGLTSALAEGWTTPPLYEYLVIWDRGVHDAAHFELARLGPAVFFWSPSLYALGFASGGSSFKAAWVRNRSHVIGAGVR